MQEEKIYFKNSTLSKEDIFVSVRSYLKLLCIFLLIALIIANLVGFAGGKKTTGNKNLTGDNTSVNEVSPINNSGSSQVLPVTSDYRASVIQISDDIKEYLDQNNSFIGNSTVYAYSNLTLGQFGQNQYALAPAETTTLSKPDLVNSIFKSVKNFSFL